MAEDPFYVNVGERPRAVKDTGAQYYSNVELQSNRGNCEEYQIVQEQGRDPHAEYTATVNSAPEKVSEDTLSRQKMLHNLLFPPTEKTQVKRFNYTDIQITTPASQFEEDEAGMEAVVEPKKPRPKVPVKPKPKLLAAELELEDSPLHSEVSVEDMEEQIGEELTVPKNASFGSNKAWKCTTAVFLTLFVVSLCISLIAISIAVTAFATIPGGCDEYDHCVITPVMNNTCDISVSEDLKVLVPLLAT